MVERAAPGNKKLQFNLLFRNLLKHIKNLLIGSQVEGYKLLLC